jgi:MFS-type transporter involved in bile tolerance (Atg22 family)
MIPEIGEIIVGGLFIALVCEVGGLIKGWWKSDEVQKHRKVILSAIISSIICYTAFSLKEMKGMPLEFRILNFLLAFGSVWLVIDWVERVSKRE